MKRKDICGMFVYILLIVFGLNGVLFAEDVQKKTYTEFKEDLSEEIPGLMQKYNVEGVAISMLHNGTIEWSKGFGIANKAKGQKVIPNTIFQVASVSKSVTAWGVLKLVENGKLELDAPVEKYLKSWHLPDSNFDNDKITIRALLSHTSGIASVGYPGTDPEENIPSLKESLSGSNGVSIYQEPGKAYLYSGAGYTILQLVVEEVTGKSFSEYMENEILKPLGMNNSFFEYKPGMENMIAKPYGVFGEEMPLYMYTEKAAAGLYTTSEDLARFAAAGMKGKNGEVSGRGILRPETIEMMQTPVKGKYGLGYIIYNFTDQSKAVLHTGDNRGWRSGYITIPNKREGIVILANSDRAVDLVWDVFNQWSKWNTGETQSFYKKVLGKRQEMGKVTLGLRILLLVLVIYLAIGFVRGKRRFIRKLEKKLYLRIAGIVFLIILMSGWVAVFYTGIFFGGWVAATRLPAGFDGLSSTVILLCFSMLVFVFYPTVKCKTKKGVDYHESNLH